MKHTNCGNKYFVLFSANTIFCFVLHFCGILHILSFSAILLLFLKLLFYGNMLVLAFSAILLLFQKIFDLRENASFAILRKIAFSYAITTLEIMKALSF